MKCEDETLKNINKWNKINISKNLVLVNLSKSIIQIVLRNSQWKNKYFKYINKQYDSNYYKLKIIGYQP